LCDGPYKKIFILQMINFAVSQLYYDRFSRIFDEGIRITDSISTS
jgi:hypothetical protein